MAATPAQIRSALAGKLTSAFPNVVVSAYRLEAPPDQSLQIIGTDSVEYDQAMQRGLDRWTFQIQALAGSPVSQQAQTLLDTWKEPTGSSSVKAAVEADPTLGAVVQSARVVRASGDSIYDFALRGEMLGCVFDVDVWNTGK